MRTPWPTRWKLALLSQETALHNAHRAAIRLAQHRAAREDADRFVAEHLARRRRRLQPDS